MEDHSAIKRGGIVPFTEMWTDLESVIQSEVSQKNKYGILMHVCGIQKNAINDLIRKAETERWTWRANVYPRQEGGGMDGEIGVDVYTLLMLHVECINITNENLLCSAGDPTPCSAVT